MRKNAPRRRKVPFSKSIVRTVGIPDKMFVKLPYTDLQGLVGTSAAPQVQKAYNINSLFDPEPATLNQQNLYFAQYMTLYRKYRVYKVDYNITFWNVSSGSAAACSLSFDERYNQQNIIDIQQLSKPYSRRFTLAPAGNTGSFKTIKGSIYMPRVLGLTPEQYRTSTGVEATWGTEQTSPARIVQLSANIVPINFAVPANIQMDVRYICHVELFDRDTTVVSTDAPVEEE